VEVLMMALVGVLVIATWLLYRLAVALQVSS
jgi:hypothetical protein